MVTLACDKTNRRWAVEYTCTLRMICAIKINPLGPLKSLLTYQLSFRVFKKSKFGCSRQAWLINILVIRLDHGVLTVASVHRAPSLLSAPRNYHRGSTQLLLQLVADNTLQMIMVMITVII